MYVYVAACWTFVPKSINLVHTNGGIVTRAAVALINIDLTANPHPSRLTPTLPAINAINTDTCPNNNTTTILHCPHAASKGYTAQTLLRGYISCSSMEGRFHALQYLH